MSEQRLTQLETEARAQIIQCASTVELDQIKAKYLGKRGEVSSLLSSIAKLSIEEKKTFGAQVNLLRERLLELLEAQREQIAQNHIAKQLSQSIDPTLPTRESAAGSIHPLKLVEARICKCFGQLGFDVSGGPEIEDDYHNFGALNHPPDHPARSMHDTFYLQSDARLLRTHTSPVQIRYMLSRPAPIKVIAPGRVYRVDHDATHSPMFHQLEGMWLDKHISFADLKGVLTLFVQRFFDDERIDLRFRPSYFPFTEPSAECDILFNGNWLEVAGCGMTHPNVIRAGGHDPDKVQGFAFGIGIDRLAMLYYNITDIRLFYENDLRFLRQFIR